MSDVRKNIAGIAGADYSDWISGTGTYTVDDGFEAYTFMPGTSGATIDTGTWIVNKTTKTATTITDTTKSQWIDTSITVGPLVFAYPVATIKLSAGDGLLYCRKSDLR